METIALVIVILLLLVYNTYTTYMNRKYEHTLIDLIITITNPQTTLFQPIISGGVTQSESDEPPLTVEEMLEKMAKDKEEGIPVY